MKMQDYGTLSHLEAATNGTFQPPNSLSMKQPTQDHASADESPSREQDDGPTEPPPPYASTAAPRWEPSTKVAMLPFRFPTGGSVYSLACLELCRHDHLMVRGTKTSTALLVTYYRAFTCYVKNTHRASRRPRHADEAGNIKVPTPLNAIGPGEVQNCVIDFDWTPSWDFVLTARSLAASKTGEEWGAMACLYFRDISASGSDSIPWNDTSRTQKVEGNPLPSKTLAGKPSNEWLTFTWKFCERSLWDCPRWGASFTIYYQAGGNMDKGQSEYGYFTGLDNPWVFFDPKDIEM